MMRKTVLLLALPIAACSDPQLSEQSSGPGSVPVNIEEAVALGEPAKAAGPIKYQVEACKAAIAVIMGRDPKTMSGKIVEGDLAHISYIRTDDGKRWQNRCRGDAPSKLTWAAFDAFGDGKQGRWRTEEPIDFKVAGDKLTVTVDQFGEPQTETYRLADLK